MSSTPSKPTTTAPESPELRFLSGGGEMGARMRAFDWSTSPVGPAADWPQGLKTAVSICIGSRYPIVIWWGNPEYTMFYNDGYIPVLGVTKHPGWLGRSGKDCWKEIWSTVGPMLEGVFETGVATWSEDLLLVMERNIPREENYFTFSYSPIRDDAGKVPGIFCACYESTGQVIGERRLRTLRDLGRTVMEVKSAEEACAAAARTLESNPHDVPFALLYLLDDKAQNARLIATTGFEDTAKGIPEQVALNESAAWPFVSVLESGVGEVVSDLTARFGALPGGPWPESPEAAYVLPIAVPGVAKPTGFLVGGLSPRRVIDADYRSFFDLIAGHVGTAIANARAYQEERKRAEALAEIDRAKTTFFSNVSHEFRTPLTLMLGPLEEALTEAALLPEVRERLDVAHRNSVRLLKLVNTLLDFSRIEAGRIEAVYEPVDLCTLTMELASMFRSAIEKAGLTLIVDCQPLSTPVYVDREMWEKIVFNLLSNAFKFTFEGGIKISLKENGDRIELAVSDTGTGIPQDELQHLFERFHRVKGARGRS
ncbi:MAG TPA: GAF domain-containing sensor histidine kinase, partial [Pyrinomonadaceae bacterium]|nr:GAF domain-containing sensor histidine kinase [Pyrinomonadaceae bacterium]